MSRQSRFDARYWMLGAGALGRPRGMVCGGRREEGSGWGTHVYLWWIHFDIWQNQYNIVNFKNKIKFKKNFFLKKKEAIHSKWGPILQRRRTKLSSISKFVSDSCLLRIESAVVFKDHLTNRRRIYFILCILMTKGLSRNHRMQGNGIALSLS